MNYSFNHTEDCINKNNIVISTIVDNSITVGQSIITLVDDVNELNLINFHSLLKDEMKNFNSNTKKKKICFIQSFSTFDGFREKGFGKALLQHICDQDNFHIALLSASPTSKDTDKERLIGFYKKYGGFRVIQKDEDTCFMLFQK